ncbi:MAG: outer membrane beta-barrel protein [Myxococcales bacterium]|nr:outer membrane beta-barrel protein [Myxococcales bacterium]
MIRRISSLALGLAFTFTAVGAFAQEGEGGGEEKAADAPAAGEEKPAGDAAAGGEAKAEGAAEMSGPPDAGGKIKVGLRLGYMLPMGDAAKDVKLGDSVSGGIPIWLDLGYMVTPNIMVGLYASYAFLMLDSKIKDACDAASADCSATQLRFGLQGQYHLSPGEGLDPWFGLGLGMEMVDFKQGDAKGGFSGLEFANIQAGADFKAMDNFTVGPFLSFSIGQYSKITGDNEADIKDKAMHQWLTLGVKGTFGF